MDKTNLDYNPIENMKTVLKDWACARKHTHFNKFYQFCQGEWTDIQPEFCQKQKSLIRMKRHLVKS